MKKQRKDIMVIGFALFAMFFGAGNLIFPPYLGLTSGSQWSLGFITFTFADAGLALLAILATIQTTGTLEGIAERIGKIPAILLCSSILLCIGPLLAIPRTAATTFELGISPIFNAHSSILFSIIYFALVMVLTVRPSKVVDIIGNFLTPGLLIALAVLIIKGIFTPLGSITIPTSNTVFKDGLLAGYQTMDMLGALVFIGIITKSVTDKNYTEPKEKISMVIKSGLLAVVGLMLVYGGLTYLGATTSSLFGKDISQANLLLAIVKGLLGNGGTLLLGIIVALACLTTAIGLTSAVADYFSKLFKERVNYVTIVVVVCAFSAFITNFGLSKIVAFAAPILSIVYPAALTLVVLAFFSKKIKNDYVFKFACAGALIVSFITVINPYLGNSLNFINRLPLSPEGFNWVLPAIICGIVGAFVNRGGKEIQPTREQLKSS